MSKKIIGFSLIIAILIICSSFLTIFAEEAQGPPPTQFSQAPQFEKMVENGELPPVKERIPLPEDLYVVKPNEKIGQYGGSVRTASIVPEGTGGDTLLSIFPNPVKPSPDLSEIVPHVAKKLESSADTKQWTMHLRKGMKWSDGQPFTADDVIFWYEDMLMNDELTPVVGETWKSGGEVVQVSKVDDYTVKFTFSAPKPFFANRLVHTGAWDLFMPKHYLKQFHPNYVDQGELQEKTEQAGFDHWYELFGYKNSTIWGTPIRKERPGLAPYVLEKLSSDRRVFKSNPYYWKVDTAGNQLPYIDKIECSIVSDLEVVQGQIMSGQLDFAARNTDLRNFPMYKRYEDKGGYKTLLWDTTYGNAVFFMVNHTHEDPTLRKIFQNVKFKRALSLAIDRNEINEVVYFAKGTPRQFTMIPTSKYFEEEFAESYADYDAEQAKQLLEEMGLTDSNGDGWREGPDGKNITFTIEYADVFVPRKKVTQLVVDYWRKIGLNVTSKQISGELQAQRAPANLMDATNWGGGRESDVLFPIQANYYLVPHGTGWERTVWPLWGTWFATEGKKGEEPPQEIKELHSWWIQVLKEPDKEKRIELSKKILEKQAENLWMIGTVGMIPHPIIVNKDIHNFPKSGYWGWDTATYCMNRDPSQIFFED